MVLSRWTVTSAALGSVILVVALVYAKKNRRRKLPQVGKFVVFLDIDGVINRTKRNDQIILRPDLVSKLKVIVERGGKGPAQIVLSTYWKCFDDYIAYALSRQGIDARLVVGSTPGKSKSTTIQSSSAKHLLHLECFDDVSLYPNRAAEIRAFIKKHPQIERYVILDDRDDAADGELLPAFVQTKPEEGLTDEHVKRALNILA
jgi:hypothetical protein